MSEAKLDQLVKGAPASDKVLPAIPSSGVISSSNVQTSDPLAHLPSSPPQIYLNLLILEASLRAQYLEIRARRRQYTFFLTLLAIWNVYFAYALFLAPREDGSGVGGSVYWVVEVTEKVCFMGGIVTGILVWGTGQWERGIRWPRRWVGITNRGLRGFNCKIVVVKGPWWKEWLSTLSFLFSNDLFFGNADSSYRYVDHNLQSDTEKGSRAGLPNIHEDEGPIIGHEEDLAPGGDIIKLLLLPKPFSPSFRENWDLYRTEYWERENERRRILLAKLKIQDKLLAKSKPRASIFSRFRLGRPKTTPKDVEKSHHAHGQHKQGTNVSEKRLLRGASTRSGSHSRTSSRSSTPTPELEDGVMSSRPRRGSTASTSSSTRSDSLRKKKPSSGTNASAAATARMQKLTPAAAAAAGGAAPGHGSPLVREDRNSFSSTDGSSRPVTPAERDNDSVRSLRMAASGIVGPGVGIGLK
jgi:hypothetical protein